MKPGKPSHSAIRIAVIRLTAARDPVLRRLVTDPDEPFSVWFVELHSPLAADMLRFRLATGGNPAPGGLRDDVYHLLRKRFVEDEARGALDKGAEQVVVLGAGYDTLALRLAAAYPGVRFFELDHPDTQAVKRRALEAHEALPASLTLLPVDLTRDSVEEALRAAGFRAGAPTLFIAEGLLPYLPEPAVDRLFEDVRSLAGPGSRLVFTAVDSRLLTDPEGEMARIAGVSALCGEPILSSVDVASLTEYLGRRGFRCRDIVDSPVLRRRYLEPLGLDRGVSVRETMVVAEVL